MGAANNPNQSVEAILFGNDAGTGDTEVSVNSSGELLAAIQSMVATAAEGGSLPSEFVVVAGDDGTDVIPFQLTSSGDLKITLDGETVTVGDNGSFDINSLPGQAGEGSALPSTFYVVAGDDGTDVVPLQLTSSGDLKITLDGESLPAGNNNIGNVDLASALPSGSNNVGEVDAKTFTVDPAVTPTISTSAYASGDLVGGKMTFSNAARASGEGLVVESVAISDLAQNDAELDLVLFDEDPTNTTFTDNSAFDVADADLDKVAGVIKVAASDYVDFSDNSVGVREGLGIAAQAAGTDLFGGLVVRGSPTYASTSDLTVRLGVLQD